MQTLFLIQSMVVNLLPFNYFGIICNVHLCLLYSLYSFEYKWCNMGWELHKRLTYIETNWPYFLGFGTIMTIFTQLTSSIIIRFVGCVIEIQDKKRSKMIIQFNNYTILSSLNFISVVASLPSYFHSVYSVRMKRCQL